MNTNHRTRRLGGGIVGVAIIAFLAVLAIVLPVRQPTAIPDDPIETEATAGESVRTTSLSFVTSDGQTLAATLHVPVGAESDLPGMVLVHGAGPGPRSKYRVEAEAFARAGIATLTYDKRTEGYSLMERSYERLAADATAAAASLRQQPGIDPDNVGIWGFSEGGWVAPMAAARDPETAFLVVVGANGVEPLRQQTWADASKLEYLGVRGSLVDAGSRTLYRLISGMGMFPEPYYDPTGTLRELTLPVLGIWGAKDRLTPPVESVTVFHDQLDQAGNRHYTLRTFADAEHSLRTTDSGYDESAEFAPGYVEQVGSWVGAVAAGEAPPNSVQGVGDQVRSTEPVPPLAWYESVWLHLAALVMMLVGFAGLPVIAGRRRIRGRRGIAAPWAARILAITAPIAVLGALSYLGYLQMTQWTAAHPGLLVAGRPLPWLILQGLSLVAVGATVAFAIGVVRCGFGGDRLRGVMLLSAGGVFVLWSLYWGLLLP